MRWRRRMVVELVWVTVMTTTMMMIFDDDDNDDDDGENEMYEENKLEEGNLRRKQG
jgi:hypothetical protein